MPVDLRSGIVRIQALDGTTAGTGFVVSNEGLIATCSHVVQSEAAQQRDDPRPETLQVMFVATGEERDARVDAAYWRARDEGDIAFLRLPDGLPEGVTPLPLGPAAHTAGHRFRTRGFRGDNERLGDGEILGFVPVGTGLPALQLRSQEVTQGYSGAPVWDEQIQCVIGMISDIAEHDEHGRGRETAFAIPSESLRDACTSLVLTDATALGLTWLTAFHGEQAAVAGEKYRPDLHVDLLISKDVAGLGLSQSIVDEYELLRMEFLKATRYMHSPELSDPEMEQAWQAVEEAVKATTSLVRVDAPFSRTLLRFGTMETALGDLAALVELLELTYFRRGDDIETGDLDVGDDRDSRERLNRLIYDCRTIRRSASALLDWLQIPSVGAAQSRLYFLTGSAGSGKTHLFLDSVHNALMEGRPALVLHGARFSGDLWASICDQLGLAPLGKDALLATINAVAEAAGTDGGRFVIMVDAINETPIERYWETNLPLLRAAISLWPNLALAVSCRDTYVDVIDPLNERNRFVVVDHPGFAGKEIDAITKYFRHYGLEAPRIPLLTPEFSVPLFLRLYCESLADAGGADAAVGHEGRIKIFERYLNSKIDRVAQRVFASAGSNLEVQRHRRRVRRALDALLDRLAEADAEWLRLDDAEAAIAEGTSGDSSQALAILGAFENEGVLSQEPQYLLQDGDGIAVRLLFQAFSDFLLLKRRLDQCSDPLNDETVKAWLRDTAGWGVLEAATVVFPERYDTELPDFLELDESLLSQSRNASEEDWRQVNRVRHVFRSLAETLPYRSSEAVTQRSVHFLNVALQSDYSAVDLYNLVYTIAPQPNNLLNAAGLHDHLARQTMPRRDASFGFYVYHSLSEETTGVARLARWAADGPYPSYSDEVIELSATALAWLLSSANRRMRDWVTKALVQLLHGHLDVMCTLLNRFWNVNDPYIVQRVVLIAYGSLMRGGQEDRANARLLVENVLDKFTEQPLRMDELLLDFQKGIIEWGIWQELLPAEVRTRLARPHGFPTLGHPLSVKRIEAKYETSYMAPRAASYSSIFNSIFGLGDFGRYVVDSSLYRFTRLRPGTLPPPEPSSEWRPNKHALRRFEKSLSSEQIQRINEHFAYSKNSDLDSLLYPEDHPSPIDLSDEQAHLLRAIWIRPTPAADIHFSNELARRWLFLRTISLGWRPDLFGEQDYYLRERDGGRSEHKPERWGKKYQWIAFHELMARLADNYQARPQHGEERAEWDPYLRLDSMRDLDPSLPPVQFHDFVQRNEEGITWRDTGIGVPGQVELPVNFESYHGDIERFIGERREEPLAYLVALRKDSSDRDWIALHSYEGLNETIGDDQQRGLTQTFWLHSWFISGEDVDQESDSLLRVLMENEWAFNTPSHERGAYWGELSWMNRVESGLTADWRLIGRSSIAQASIIDTCEDYLWDGNDLDCSIENAARAYVPSRFILDRMSLTATDEGPGWDVPGGDTVFVNTRGSHEEYPQSHHFWIQRDWIQEFLNRENLALAVATWFERLSHSLIQTPQDKREVTLSAAILTADGQFLPVVLPNRSPWPTDADSWIEDK